MKTLAPDRARSYPAALSTARQSTLAVFDRIVFLVDAADPGVLRSPERVVSTSISRLARSTRTAPTSVRRSLAYLARRGLVEKLAPAQGRRTSLRVNWSGFGPLPHARARELPPAVSA
ncbi:MAG: hypothetical protein WCQ45_01540, partial [bacterium]